MIIYGDFKCFLIVSTDNIDFGPNAQRYQDRTICSYVYKCLDEQYSKMFKTGFNEDAIDKLLDGMIK